VIIFYYAKKYKIPYIIQPHGSFELSDDRLWLKKIFDRLWGFQLLRNASKIITSSNKEAEQFLSIGIQKDRIAIIPNGVEIKEFEKLPLKGKFKEKYKILKEERFILYLGRLHRIKGIDLLINAFSDLSKEMEGTRLVIVGPDDGMLVELLKQTDDLKLTNKIIFTGRIDNETKLAAYTDADVSVLPSVYECFAVTAVEAWSCGTPLIISEGCLFSEYLPDNAAVFRFDRTQLKNLIKQVLLDQAFRNKIRNDGEYLVKNKFNWSKIIIDYKNVYSDIVKKKKFIKDI
jgi:glycosyltransferase involved in cell wall biosynthesis